MSYKENHNISQYIIFFRRGLSSTMLLYSGNVTNNNVTFLLVKLPDDRDIVPECPPRLS